MGYENDRRGRVNWSITVTPFEKWVRLTRVLVAYDAVPKEDGLNGRHMSPLQELGCFLMVDIYFLSCISPLPHLTVTITIVVDR